MYELGLLVAFILWLWSAIALLIAINSTFERNLNRIGQRLSWLSLEPVPLAHRKHSASRSVGKYLLITCVSLSFIFLSWLYVGLYLGLLVYRKSKDFDAPQAVKELRWKMRNLEMSFDQICAEMIALVPEAQRAGQTIEQFREQMAKKMQEDAYVGSPQQAADEREFCEYTKQQEDVRNRFDQQGEWNEGTQVPAEYLDEIRKLNLVHQGMLRRRNDWTDGDFRD